MTGPLQSGFTLERVSGGVGTKPVALDEHNNVILVCGADTSIARYVRMPEAEQGPPALGRTLSRAASTRAQRRWHKTHVYERVTAKPVSRLLAWPEARVALALHSNAVHVLDASQQPRMADLGPIPGSQSAHAVAFLPETATLACCLGKAVAILRAPLPAASSHASASRDAASEITVASGRAPVGVFIGEDTTPPLSQPLVRPDSFRTVAMVEMGMWAYGVGFASPTTLIVCLRRDFSIATIPEGLPSGVEGEPPARPRPRALSVPKFAFPRQPDASVSPVPGGGAVLLSGPRILFVSAEGVLSRLQVEISRNVHFAAVRGPFLIVTRKDRVEVRHNTPMSGFALAQVLDLQSQSAVSAGGAATHSLTFLSATDFGVSQLRMVPLRVQIEKLAAVGNFEAAKTLCDQMPIAPGPGDRTADGVEDLSRALELLLGFQLWFKGDHEAALHHMLTASPEDPRPLLSLLPSTLPCLVHPSIHTHVVEAVDSQLLGIALVSEALRKHNTLMDAGALSRASSLPSSRPLSSDTPNPTPRPGHRHPSDPPTPSRGSRGSDSDAEVDHDKPRSSAPRNAAFARSISLAVPPSRTPPRPVGPSRPARASGAEPTRHAARGSSPSGASSSATPRGASPPSHAALAAPPVSSHLHAGAMAVAEDSVEAELVAWEAAMDGPTRRAVLGNVLPYLYTYRAKLGCEEAAAHVRAKLGELSRVHDMDLRAVMAGGGDNAGVGVGDSAGRDASLMTTPSTSESGSLVPEDDRLAQWMAGARQGWAVLVDTALCKVLTESQQGGMWGDANGGSGAVGKGDESGGGGGGGGGGRSGAGGRDSGGDEKSGGGDWTRGGATGAAIDAPSAVLVDFCRGRHCVHPSEAFEFLARRGDYAPLLDVLQSQGLHAQALSALRVLACAPDTGPDSALTPPAPGSTGLVGPGAVRKTVEYCRETPGLEVGVVEGVCAWVFGRDVEAGLQILLGLDPPLPPSQGVPLLERLSQHDARCQYLDRAIAAGLATRDDWGQRLAELYIEYLLKEEEIARSRDGQEKGPGAGGGSGNQGSNSAAVQGQGQRVAGREARGSVDAGSGRSGATGPGARRAASLRLQELLATWELDVRSLLSRMPRGALLAEKAAGLLRLGEVRAALRLLVHAMNAPRVAEAWCDVALALHHDPQAPFLVPDPATLSGDGDGESDEAASGAGPRAAGDGGHAGVAGADLSWHLEPPAWVQAELAGDEHPAVRAHLTLLEVYLEPLMGEGERAADLADASLSVHVEGRDRRTITACRMSADRGLRLCRDLLERKGRVMDPRRALACIPGEVALSALDGVLSRVLAGLERDWRVQQLLRALAKSEGLVAREELAATQSLCVRVTYERACWVCNKRLGSGAFASMPDGRVVHFMCFGTLGNGGAGAGEGWGSL